MEELRSTAVLDKEIRKDSKKKAEKILAKAEESAKALIEEVQSRVKKAGEDAENASKARIAVFERNDIASIPLEKQRFLVSYINDSIVEAMKDYFQKIDSSKKDRIIEGLVEKVKSILGDSKVNAVVHGELKTAAAKKILKKSLGDKVLDVSYENTVGDNIFDYGIILSSEDGRITCRLTLEEKINELLGEKREKLALSLFGGRLPE